MSQLACTPPFGSNQSAVDNPPARADADPLVTVVRVSENYGHPLIAFALVLVISSPAEAEPNANAEYAALTRFVSH